MNQIDGEENSVLNQAARFVVALRSVEPEGQKKDKAASATLHLRLLSKSKAVRSVGRQKSKSVIRIEEEEVGFQALKMRSEDPIVKPAFYFVAARWCRRSAYWRICKQDDHAEDY